MENVNQEEPKIVVNEKEYLINDLSDEVKELVSLWDQARNMSINAKRQAAIHDLSVQSLSKMVEEKLENPEEE
jgi:hypothetical protein|tara:strand:- start:283 stop:501 length:219 start_codon:yes stop_codon:yes gene_type:complete